MMTAFLAALSYFICYAGNWLLGQCMIERPIVVGMVTGLLLGDVTTGVMIGAALEAIYMGAVNIGGATSAEPVSATVLSTTFAITSGLDMSTAITLAIPVGLIFNYVNLAAFFLCSFFSPWFDKCCENGDGDGVMVMALTSWFTLYFLRAVIIFVAVLLGSTVVQQAMASLPAFVLQSFGVCAGLLGCVGMALLLKMLWRGDIAIFFFIGFAIVKYLNLPAIVVALIAVAIALMIALRDKQVLDLKTAGPVQTAVTPESEEEEFFG